MMSASTSSKHIDFATTILHQGGIIAYPTEAVFGLGCDPYNKEAVQRLLALKQREESKGLILIAADWANFIPLLEPIAEDRLHEIQQSWPGPYTWLFPAKATSPKWLKGKHDTQAVRVTAHPIARELCLHFSGPIVSTSANIEGQIAARSATEVEKIFKDAIDYIVPGEIGVEAKPTVIRDALTDKVIRCA